jgi:hypothetical protein
VRGGVIREGGKVKCGPVSSGLCGKFRSAPASAKDRVKDIWLINPHHYRDLELPSIITFSTGRAVKVAKIGVKGLTDPGEKQNSQKERDQCMSYQLTRKDAVSYKSRGRESSSTRTVDIQEKEKPEEREKFEDYSGEAQGRQGPRKTDGNSIKHQRGREH